MDPCIGSGWPGFHLGDRVRYCFGVQTSSGVSGSARERCGGDRRIAVYRIDDQYFATSDVCPHQGGTLSEGCVVDGWIECPLHFALFDIRTGAADGGLTTKSVKTFPTKVENDEVHVDVNG